MLNKYLSFHYFWYLLVLVEFHHLNSCLTLLLGFFQSQLHSLLNLHLHWHHNFLLLLVSCLIKTDSKQISLFKRLKPFKKGHSFRISLQNTALAFEPKSTKYKIKPIHFSNYFENNRIRERERGKKRRKDKASRRKKFVIFIKPRCSSSGTKVTLNQNQKFH